MRNMLALFSALALVAVNGLGEEPAKAPRLLALPVNGANAGCCTAAVKEALEALPGVVSVRIESAEGSKLAIVTLDEKAELRLSEVTRVLDEAAKDMAAMMGGGIRYVVDRDRLAVGEGAFLLVGEGANAKLVAGVPGVAGADVDSLGDVAGLRIHIQPKAVVKLNPLAAAVAKSGGEVSDLVLAPNFDPSTKAKEPQKAPPQNNPPKGGGGGGC